MRYDAWGLPITSRRRIETAKPPPPDIANMQVKLVVGRDGVVHIQTIHNQKVINNVDISPDKIQYLIDQLKESKEKSIEARANSIKNKMENLKAEYEASIAPYMKELENLGFVQ